MANLGLLSAGAGKRRLTNARTSALRAEVLVLGDRAIDEADVEAALLALTEAGIDVSRKRICTGRPWAACQQPNN